MEDSRTRLITYLARFTVAMEEIRTCFSGLLEEVRKSGVDVDIGYEPSFCDNEFCQELLGCQYPESCENKNANTQ